MKITQSKAKNLVAKIIVNINESDYIEKVDKALKDYRKTVVLPGFRKGKTPMSIINKKYRSSVIVEEVNKLLQDELYKYITAEKIKVLGSPMPINQKEMDWSGKVDLVF